MTQKSSGKWLEEVHLVIRVLGIVNYNNYNSPAVSFQTFSFLYK